MNYGSWLVLAAMCVLAVPEAATAQNDVTFVVPVNLTDLSPEIDAIQIRCRVISAAIVPGGQYETSQGFPVVDRRVATTATLTVRLSTLNDPAGKRATYVCTLTGRRGPDGEWQLFSATPAHPAFRLTPTPEPLTGTFDWLQPPPLAPAPVLNRTTTSPGNAKP